MQKPVPMSEPQSCTLGPRTKIERAKRNATAKKTADGGPEVLRFKARLVRLHAMAKTDAWLLEIPKTIGAKLHGMTRAEGIINGHPFRAALEPATSGSRLLRVNQAMRKGARADAGDTVSLAILGPEPEPAVAADLGIAFKGSPKAAALWKDLTTECRRDYVRWIDSTNNPDTRARRVRRTVEQLAEGKRRPCCVNVYEFMLRRVQE